MATHVELRELWRSFGPVTALQGINLSLDTGEFVSLLGPAGPPAQHARMEELVALVRLVNTEEWLVIGAWAFGPDGSEA